MADADVLRTAFTLRGIEGAIDVSLTRNTDPGSLGYLLLSGGEPVDFARDFPVCRASVTYPADGYAAMFHPAGAHREACLPDLRRIRRVFAASTSFVLALRAAGAPPGQRVRHVLPAHQILRPFLLPARRAEGRTR